VVESLVGSGGFGTVYRCRDLVTDREVALKLFESAGDSNLSWVRQEVSMLRLLQFPGVVPLIDDGVRDGAAYLVTEFQQANPFPGFEGPASWPLIAAATRSLLEVLERVHAQRVVHRDIKPGNVLVDEAGEVVLLDFGVAADVDPEGALIRHTGVVGTPAFLAPEQLSGSPVDARTDLYAVGVMLYRTLTGLPPFGRSDGNASEALRRRLEAPPPHWPSGLYVPESVATTISRLLSADPAARPASASAVRAGLFGDDVASANALPEALNARFETHTVWTEQELHTLFAGPDPIWHLREDAAAELHERTGGDAAELREELLSWLSTHVARWDGARLVLTRGELDRLRNGPRLRMIRHGLGAPPLPPAARHLLAWCVVAGPRASRRWIDACANLPPGQLEASWRQLEAAGAVRLLRDDRVEARVASPELDALPASQVADMHQRLRRYIDRGDRARLLHALASGRADSVSEDAEEVAERSVRDGQFAEARAALAEGLAAERRRQGPDLERCFRLLALWLSCAASEATVSGVDRLLFEIDRTQLSIPARRCLESTAHAVRLGFEGRAAAALTLLEGISEADRPRLLGVWETAHANVVLSGDAELGARALRSLEAWAERSGRAEARVVVEQTRATAAFRALEFEAMVAHGNRAAALAVQRGKVTASWLLTANGLKELCRFDEAASLLEAVADEARQSRNPTHEALAAVHLRSIAYRRGEASAPSLEFVEALRALPALRPRSTGLFTEAAHAWRVGEPELARALAAECAGIARRAGTLEIHDLMVALVAELGGEVDDDEVRRIVSRAAQGWAPGLAAQTLALLARHPRVDARVCDAVSRRASVFWRETPGSVRRELLSPDETLQRLRGVAAAVEPVDAGL
jgi:serine/threonine-protein kinase